MGWDFNFQRFSDDFPTISVEEWKKNKIIIHLVIHILLYHLIYISLEV